jgi:transposase InsO family protein
LLKVLTCHPTATRVWGILRREAIAEGCAPANRKRIYRVMRAHGLLLQRHAGGDEERRHDGKIAVERSNLRWCSDGFEIACGNAKELRVAFALDCCDRGGIVTPIWSCSLAGGSVARGMKKINYKGYRFLPEVIQQIP